MSRRSPLQSLWLLGPGRVTGPSALAVGGAKGPGNISEMTSQHRVHAWNDDPITNKSQDEFGRARYAERAADLIARTHSWETSLVFGLTGPWGSGKSSLIEMIVNRMTAEHRDWKIARFTPWATDDVTGMLSEFYAAIGRALGESLASAGGP